MAVLKPATADALSDAVRGALAAGRPLELMGGGTKRGIGRPVEAEDLLDLSGLAGIRLYQPEELVLTAGAGTPLPEIEAALAERGQHLAFEPPDLASLLGSAGVPTLGGILAANLAGPRRLSAGAARDHLLGFTAVSGRGEAFKSGGRVVKNVTGYDLSKLVAGSWGTLAALAEVTVKVMPRPAAAATLLVSGVAAADGVALMAAAMGSPHEVASAAWLPAGLARAAGLERAEPAVLLRLEGPEPSVAWRARALGEIAVPFGPVATIEAAAVWRALRDVTPLAAERCRAVWKVSVPPAAGARLLAAVPEAEGFLDWAGGLAWLTLAEDADAARLRAAAAALGGHATLIRASAALRARVAVFEPLPPALEGLTRRVKASFDPAGLFNPGRMHRGI